MKILIIDDQQLILLPLKKRLMSLGYEVAIESNAKNAFQSYILFKPDLVILDLNMPDVYGLDIVKLIRFHEKDLTPIMVLSGEEDEETILKGFELGINDYMKKPVSLTEVCKRVERLIGHDKLNLDKIYSQKSIIPKSCVGIVVPFFKVENKENIQNYVRFINQNIGCHLCFINVSGDIITQNFLNELRKSRESFISVFNYDFKISKSELLRLGMLHLSKHEDLDYIGFCDSQFINDLSDLEQIVKNLETQKFKLITGLRLNSNEISMVSGLLKESNKKMTNFFISRALGFNLKDSHSSIKFMDKEVVNIVFNKPFLTKSLFKVEIFLRLKNYFGVKKVSSIIQEYPLQKIVNKDRFKYSVVQSFKMVLLLFMINKSYK
ncbi:response regulator [Urechidicola croceus]|uniref:Response regulatory domain-containing protein n=1 Tax=Urechidicola croceus TaxID=1850246 RepID=A0A1D8P7E3_9FLAO|nr:response regulator [Urechidicola croceus]AOW20486.1 hypothetical protein LPB138_07275 [Urechidicola croceus]